MTIKKVLSSRLSPTPISVQTPINSASGSDCDVIHSTGNSVVFVGDFLFSLICSGLLQVTLSPQNLTYWSTVLIIVSLSSFLPSFSASPVEGRGSRGVNLILYFNEFCSSYQISHIRVGPLFVNSRSRDDSRYSLLWRARSMSFRARVCRASWPAGLIFSFFKCSRICKGN